MGQRYNVIMPTIAVSAAQDLLRVAGASSKSLILRSVSVTQVSDPGDAEAEMLRFIIKRGANVGSGGAAVTPANLSSIATASSATARRNDTTPGTAGTNVVEECANMQIGFFWKPTPEEVVEVSGASSFTINLPAAPADALTMSATVQFEEIG